MNYKPEPFAIRYTVHGLDVWGNDDDGYEVNDVYGSQGSVEISSSDQTKDIIERLTANGYLVEAPENTYELELDSLDCDGWITLNTKPILKLRNAAE